MISSAVSLLFLIVLLAGLLPSYLSAHDSPDIPTLLNRMDAAYAGVNDYRAEMEVRKYGKDGSFETEKFLYTFKKPKWIRLDFESPHRGMILIYPDKDGKAVLHRFFTFHLSVDSSLLRVSSGQRIDQTDLGLLIRNIAHSLTDRRRGPVELTEEGKDLRVRVLADDHFREGVSTEYQFFIDENLWLPVRVEESTPNGHLERTIIFRNLRINIEVPSNFFQLDEG